MFWTYCRNSAGDGHIALHPQSRVLLVGADIARYGIKTAGEPTQGGGAVAMIMSANPRILKINPESAHLTKTLWIFGARFIVVKRW